jgi:hypothetical protein
MHMKLGDLITGTHQAKKLPFGSFQRCVRHDIQQANVQLTNALMTGAVRGENFFAFILQTQKSRQISVGN